MKTPIYRRHVSEGFNWPQFGANNTPNPYQRLEIEALLSGQSIPNWSKWSLEWHGNAKFKIPDLSVAWLFDACSSEAAARIWPNGFSAIHLPVVHIGEMQWHLLIPQHYIEHLDDGTSAVDWYEADSLRWVGEVRWVNILEPFAAKLSAFKLRIHPRGPTYFTESFVQSVSTLNLRGFDFKHVGYIVDSPEHAVPEPPRPPVAAPAPPRWPRWREPAVERVQASQAAGAAWLQRQGLPSAPPAADALAALAQAIEAARSPQARLGPKALKAFLAEVGGAWGHLVHRDCGWQWVELPVSSRTWRLGLASPQGSHALCLDQVIERQVASDAPSSLTLMYNMIRAGNLPPAQPGDHVVLG